MAVEIVKGRPKKGERTAGSGRQPGSPNHATKALKDAILSSFHSEEVGGESWLNKLALEQPQAYAQLLGKLVPRDIAATITTRRILEVKNLTGVEWEPKAKKLPAHVPQVIEREDLH